MKKICALFLILIGLQNANAQYGLQTSLIAPTGSYGYYLKPGLGFELKFNAGDLDKRFKLGGSIGFYKLKPTQDTFPTYGIQYGGLSGYCNGTLLRPGYEHIRSYSVITFGFVNEYKILDKKFSPTIGMDAFFYLINISHDFMSGTIEGSTDNDDSYTYAIAPKAGISYEYKDNWLFSGGLARSMSFLGTAEHQAYWKTYLSVIYYFD